MSEAASPRSASAMPRPAWLSRARADLRTTTPAHLGWVVLAVALAASLPWALRDLGTPRMAHPLPLTLVALVGLSVLNVELGRRLAGGLSHAQQPHKALSAWALACGLLLPPPALLLVVPLTYAHAGWRGLRVPLFKWVGSGAYLVLAGLAAVVARDLAWNEGSNYTLGNGGRGLLAVLAACVAFLLVETALFWVSVLLGDPADEIWLRRTLLTPGYYLTESSVLLIGGLFSAVWTGGAWFVLAVLPLYVLLQRAALIQPLRERAAVAEELAQKNAELEEANRMKVDLLAMLGHEIGNPLTTTTGYTQVARDALADGDPDTADHALAMAERGSARMGTVLSDILALVATDAGRLTAQPQPCPLAARLEAAALGSPGATTPRVHCPPDLAALVQPGHLDQVLGNLVSNAAKYAGGATQLSAHRLQGDGLDGDRIEIVVADAGPGVPDEFAPVLFDRFSRAHSPTRAHGSGLGLFITRELVRANGGEVAYRRGPQGGSQFVVTLPAA